MSENNHEYHMETLRALGRIEGKLGSLNANVSNLGALLADHIDEDEKLHGDAEKRLRSLEKFRNWCAGVLAVIGSGLGLTQIPFK